ncbi:MAG: Tol-Pal system beta propeller repeat protein TolB [Nitrospirae bacterium]|nr:Tol-Pal system beta propeller repeat protein TolB [Nitrospirota bacterium]
MFCVLCSADAKIYIDITSPALRKLPVSFAFSGSKEAEKLTEIVKNDLDFTGIFNPLEPGVKGAEITVNIDVNVADNVLTANVSVFDLIENREILRKKYEAGENIIRTLSHSISNNIYKVITGQDGVFRTRIAYITDASGKKELHLMDFDGYSDQKIVVKGLTFSHNWSHSSEYLAYSSERDKEWSIYIINLNNYNETVLFSSKGLNLVGGFSPDNIIAFSSSKDGSPEIYVMNMDGSGSKKLTESFGIDVSPVFSPDGSKIAFVSDRGGSPQIYIMNADGSSVRRLTFEGNYNTSPVWSPDGKEIAYVGRKNMNNQIFVIKLSTLEISQLTEKGNNESPSFSPDGMFIAFDSDRDGTKGVWIMRAGETGERKITSNGVKAMAPKWSPYLK